MGRTIPTAENVIKSFQTANRFRLEQGETSRVLAMEFRPAKDENDEVGPWSEWLYDIRTPDVMDGERVVSEGKWFGSYIAPGDPAAIEEFGFDPDVMPEDLQALIREFPDVFAPKRKHATNIITYNLKPGTHQLATPYGVQHRVWVFAEGVFRTLATLYDEYQDLRRYDLNIVCENKKFQKFDIKPARNSAWVDPQFNPGGGKEPGDLRQLVAATFSEQKMDGDQLSAAIATKVGMPTLRDKFTACARALGAEVAGVTPSNGSPAVAATAEEISEMLGSTPEAPVDEEMETPASDATQEAVDMDAIFDDL